MELRHLRYFTAVAEALNFRAAAVKLHVSAPTLSQQIRQLEDEMEVRLFDRQRTGTRLTNAGRVFLGEARALLASATKAQKRAKDATKGARGRLRVGYNSGLLAEFMPRCLMLFSAKFPNVDVELLDLPSGEQFEGIETDEIQLGFVAPPKGWLLQRSGLASVSVLRAVPRVVMARGHRLAKLPEVPMAELANERMLVIGGPRWISFHRDRVVRMFNLRHCKPPRIEEVNGLDPLLAMVASGECVTMLIWRRCVGYADEIAIVPLKESGPDLELDVRAIWRESDNSALQREFIAVLHNVAGAAAN
jgi:LysR family transcriptional regulator, benzoate and cis,cis-muconate-responsive activator of ben and cat genes